MTLPAIAQAVSPYRQLLVGFSGGLDSTVLLHRLKLWRDNEPDIQLRAMHIHHGLSPHADAWVAHCEAVCAAWAIPLTVERVHLQDEGLGIEAQARKARYAAFAAELQPDEALVTAQHLDDQCETLLLALKRGSGPAGLSAMPERADFAGSHLLRPLLGETRASLETWAREHELSWIEDESNQDDRYDRNFLRLRVVPLLSERWPHFAEAAARSAMLCAEQESLLDELLSEELAELISAQGSLTIAPLEAMSPARRAALLRRWLASHGAAMPSRAMLARFWDEVALAREDATPCVHLNGFDVRRYKGALWWVKSSPSLADRVLDWPSLAEPLLLPCDAGRVSLVPTGHVRLPEPGEPVTVRFKAGGLLHIVGRNGGRKLKKIWQESNVPPWRRDTTPLLFYGETLIAAAGVFITQEGWAETGVQFEWKA
ncbi:MULTISPECIES: tRNA lysidine(34) synthetase TilS [Enterobacter]|jgi:tRNA(Ile)-lysidine synthase|uniref:tRNA(Ile)-lysidine synthase n=2 Tax=Enterobacter ludwigii TaxID=299767 RepID=A0AAX3LCP6_9ENTR|nr:MULTISPECIES: tRNA lysidine(34) synthetase TilS [Enterobacter]EKS6738089.1 tRNA lysidine(34) synthetase TilS [Enterobacter ludwigii]ELK6198006.1 tRNA lysidine(34) synthetase TilS [Enterobacter ludwigii]ELN9422411.1 tRNA lysidine(34) synthetase TilS [Enterobacter ludwigii]ELP5694039.1 tRNA lysidine(34) synthetase TilS [Enterobacter ludwigii]EMD2746171.1 tRNA lysidine(34) synthetase TilS [Enterobacter ludwigii]